jgi:hypothetical protein
MNNFSSHKDQLQSATTLTGNTPAAGKLADVNPVDMPVAPEPAASNGKDSGAADPAAAASAWTDHEYPMPSEQEEQALVIRYRQDGTFNVFRPTGDADGSWMRGWDSVVTGGEFVRFASSIQWVSSDSAMDEQEPVIERKTFPPAHIGIYFQAETLKAKAKQTVYLVQDEPTADLIRSMGLPATCVALDWWQARHFPPFAEADVVLVRPDNIRRERLARKLSGVVRRLRVLEKLPEKLNGAEELTHVAEAAPEYDCRRAFSLKLGAWHEPPKTPGRKVCSGPPTPTFEAAWEANSEAMDALGYEYEKFRDEMQVSLWAGWRTRGRYRRSPLELRKFMTSVAPWPREEEKQVSILIECYLINDGPLLAYAAKTLDEFFGHVEHCKGQKGDVFFCTSLQQDADRITKKTENGKEMAAAGAGLSPGVQGDLARSRC